MTQHNTTNRYFVKNISEYRYSISVPGLTRDVSVALTPISPTALSMALSYDAYSGDTTVRSTFRQSMWIETMEFVITDVFSVHDHINQIRLDISEEMKNRIQDDIREKWGNVGNFYLYTSSDGSIHCVRTHFVYVDPIVNSDDEDDEDVETVSESTMRDRFVGAFFDDETNERLMQYAKEHGFDLTQSFSGETIMEKDFDFHITILFEKVELEEKESETLWISPFQVQVIGFDKFGENHNIPVMLIASADIERYRERMVASETPRPYRQHISLSYVDRPILDLPIPDFPIVVNRIIEKIS